VLRAVSSTAGDALPAQGAPNRAGRERPEAGLLLPLERVDRSRRRSLSAAGC